MKLINTIASTAEERIKNPFTGTFLASWIVFNWKPLVFFIFSEKNIEQKISYIISNYSDILHIVVYPLASSLFFLFLVPYINLGNESFIKKSKNEREKSLHDDKILRIQRETLEEEEKAKREIQIEIVREQKGRNQQAEELREQITILESDLNREFSEKTEILKKHSDEITKLNSLNKNLQKMLEQEIVNVKKTSEDFKNYKEKYKISETKIGNLSIPFDIEYILKIYLNTRLHSIKPRIIILGSSEILEATSPDNSKIFYDTRNRRIITHIEFAELLVTHDFKVAEIEDSKKLDHGLNILNDLGFNIFRN